MKQILLFIVLCPCLIFGQTQLGSDIDGEDVGNNSGASVSLSNDGLTVAIGAPFNSGTASAAGHVRVFRFDAPTDNWIQLGTDIDGESGSDQSGTSASLSGDGLTVAIGSPFNNGTGSNAGHVRIFQFDVPANDWIQLGLDIDGEANSDQSGSSVSLSDNGLIVAIGAEFNDGTGSNAGHVRVFQFDATSSDWLQIGLDIDGEAEFDQSGASVSLSSNGLTVAIGAKFNGGTGSNAGHVRVYRFDAPTDDWAQLGIDIDAETAADQSGSSVSISDDGLTVAIGAPDNDGTGPSAGHVRVYRFDAPTDDWVQLGVDIDGEFSDDQSGSSVSLSSNGLTIAIGSRLNDDVDFNAGHVRIYDLSSVLSTDDFVFDNFKIYPNPTSTILTIELKSGLVLEKATIYNTIGQLVQTVHSNTINVSKLNTGMYYVQVFTDKGIGTKQIIVD